MNSDAGKIEKQQTNLPYEQPSLKKYGTMKEFTLGSSGSGGDGMGSDGNNTIINDAKAIDDGNSVPGDIF